MYRVSVGTFIICDHIHKHINKALSSGQLSYGEYSRKFESNFAAMHNARYGVLSNSGTSCLQVAVQALKEIHGWNDGDEIIVPAVTFVASVNVVIHNRMTPILVDVDPRYYEIDADKIENAITPRTRAIMPVHLFGQPCDMTRICDIARRHDLKIIEDSCECMGVAFAGEQVGSFGDVGCFSTYVAHLLTTGVGGLGITNRAEIAVKMRSLVNHGRDGIYIASSDSHNLSDSQRREVISRRFRFESIGHSFRITELEAALGYAQLHDLRPIITTRQHNANYLTARLSKFADVLQLPEVRPQAEHAWMMYPIVLKMGDKFELMNYLEANGIETREMLPLIQQPCYRGMWNPNDYPIAQWIDQSGFYVGIHQGLDDSDFDYIAGLLDRYFVKSSCLIGANVENLS